MKIINGEPCELVERFENLREGMVVYTGPCPNHRVFHRSMLVGKRMDLVVGGLIDRTMLIRIAPIY